MEDYNSCVMKELKRRKCPLHLTLIASYISVEKYDKLLRTFCKEFPATMIKLNNEKKSIEAQKRTVYAMISRIQEILDFTSGRSLVEFYLNVEALNEQFVSLKSQRVQEIKGNSDSQQLWHYSHDIMNHQKLVVNLQSEIQNFKTQSTKLSLILSHSENIHRQKHLNWLQTRKWINQVHKKISHYKEVYSQPDNILEQIHEIEEFIIAARKVVKML
ncbi:uncharacterized protein LOC118198479 isoform X1 [Stegodyphus dumicola]|uniref:uncharacterized protein LOC118198479 isoform X1 n=1 Tax=Stegodyphus dumicola TaxID=202533 RepID=UPI0015AA41F4|nr:uncharacterized protein LOC118198479 isoform X1 [Stegodyphus dumicola]XP_035226065.1 uncharacterized protein LOC118198479 isoform X1 [Stegodyphus dumicola]XP_035226066.1 uncharacterized protein LOC118198479 isoform X1 [Stegodyphus dumicola]